MLPKTSAYVKSYDGETKWMHFVIKDDDLWEKYNTVCDKVSVDMEKEFLKATIKSHGDEVMDFYDKKFFKVDSNYTCSAVISLNSALKKDDNYYLQVLLKECKYIEKKVIRYIIDDLETSFDDSNDSDEEWIKDIKSMCLEKIIFKMYFLREQFWKYFLRINFWKSNFENALSEGTKCGLTDCVWERMVN